MTLEEVNKINANVIAEVVIKITTNHWGPGEKCPVCGDGIIGQIGIVLPIADFQGQGLVDGVVCSNCLRIGMKCAKYKGENSCACQDKN